MSRLGTLARLRDRLVPRLGLKPSAKRVNEHWSRVGGHWHTRGVEHWTELAHVQRRINVRISGSADVDPYLYFLRKYLAGRLPVGRALTLGCGTGELERGLVQYGFCRNHDAFDISEGSVHAAREAADRAGMVHIVYEVRDVNRIDLPEAAYDCVWGVHSIHHLDRLEHVFAEVARALRPGGHFVLNEFVGPSRFQWTDRQLEVIDGLLRVMPERLRAICREPGRLKTRVERPTIAAMMRVDPSEAARSSEILPLLPQFFEVLEVKGYGGTVLQMLLHEIAGNFRTDDPATVRLLETCFDVEESLISAGDLPHDFALVVAQKKQC